MMTNAKMDTGEKYMMVNMEYMDKLEQQIAALVKALKNVYDNISSDPDIYWKGDLLGDIEQALALVEGPGLFRPGTGDK